MKKLEVNQMNDLNGGISAQCSAQIGIHALVGGMFGGPWGYAIGAVYGYYMSPQCK